jgi:hypothetical protein
VREGVDGVFAEILRVFSATAGKDKSSMTSFYNYPLELPLLSPTAECRMPHKGTQLFP